MFAAKNELFTRPSAGGYNLTRSLRFRASASAYLNRTFSTPTDNKKFTWSAWVKRGTLGAKWLFSATPDAFTTYVNFGFADGSGGSVDALTFDQYSGGYQVRATTNALYRDPATWYHIVLVWDSANATSTERTQIWVNGVRTTVTYAFGPVSQNTASVLNATSSVNYLGSLTSSYFDGYMAEVNFIDGQALTPSSFGAYSIYNQWLPIDYAGTYGTNGFNLPFTNNASAATLGNDFSGNGNTWTTNNISVTAGVTYDSMTDVPTLTSATAANFAVLNPLAFPTTCTLAGGNLNATAGSLAECDAMATIQIPTTGKWYWEVNVTAIGVDYSIGIYDGSSITNYTGTGNYRLYRYTGQKLQNSGNTAYGATYITNDVIGVALDADAGTLVFYKNNVSQGTAFTDIATASQSWKPTIYLYSTASCAANFGQRPFSYTPPTGFVALNTYNLPAGSITTSGSFTGNVSTDGPFVYLNGVPTAMTINGNAVTFGTNADKLANGFKVRSSSSSYNASGSNTYSITTTGSKFKNANAQINP